jgi:hypothetical protein
MSQPQRDDDSATDPLSLRSAAPSSANFRGPSLPWQSAKVTSLAPILSVAVPRSMRFLQMFLSVTPHQVPQPFLIL